MSILTGCVCSECKKWHSHINEKGDKYVCVNCYHKKIVKLKGGKKK